MYSKLVMDNELIGFFGNSKKRVTGWVINGNTVFIKKSAPFKRHMGHILQGLLYLLTKNPILAPSVLKKEENDVAFQVDRLRKLRNYGLRVPTVLYADKDYFIMTDMGENLLTYLKKNPKKANECLERAMAELAGLHDCGFIHGGAQIRNYLIKDGVVALIDFEEKAEPCHLEHLQIRDVILFLLSLEKSGLNPDIKRLCSLYKQYSCREVHSILYSLFHKYRWIRIINLPVFNFIRMGDVRALIRLMDKFKASGHPS